MWIRVFVVFSGSVLGRGWGGKNNPIDADWSKLFQLMWFAVAISRAFKIQ